MSSYLSIYIVPKRKNQEEKKKHIILSSYSRSTEIYQKFWETVNPAFIGNKEHQYTKIGKDEIALVLDDFDKEIKSMTATLNEYEKYAKDNPEYIQNILDYKEDLSNLHYWRDKTSFIQDIVNDTDFYESGVEEVCCNID